MSKSFVPRLAVSASALILLTGCGWGSAQAPSVSQTSAPDAPVSSVSSSMTTQPRPVATQEQPRSVKPSPGVGSTADPLPKVERTDQPNQPAVSAAPVDTKEEVRYPDGVRLNITDVAFRVEDGKGPGTFPGRELALLSLEIGNGGKTAMSLDTVVVTVLDAGGQPLAPMSVPEGDVQDFAGEVPPGDTAKARYAFALPTQSRSQVTVVVDFDGHHTSAVFIGSLG